MYTNTRNHTTKIFLPMVTFAFFTLISCTVSHNAELPTHLVQRKNTQKQYEIFISKGVEKKLDVKNVKATQIIETSKSYLNTPHCMGGTTHKCIDCSGLLYATFKNHGIDLPHNSEEQARYGNRIPQTENLKTGDLVFFIHTYKTSRFVTHSGIYLGNGQFIHTSSKMGVTISSINSSYWKEKFIFGTRVF